MKSRCRTDETVLAPRNVRPMDAYALHKTAMIKTRRRTEGPLMSVAPNACWMTCGRKRPGIPKSRLTLRINGRHRAHHALAETSRADAERQVEAAADVLQRDVMRQLHQLTVVEMLPKPVNSSSETVDRCAAHTDCVIQKELVQLRKQRARLIVGESQELLVGQPHWWRSWSPCRCSTRNV